MKTLARVKNCRCSIRDKTNPILKKKSWSCVSFQFERIKCGQYLQSNCQTLPLNATTVQPCLLASVELKADSSCTS